MVDKLKSVELSDLPRLREIPSPPSRLTMRGTLPPREHRMLAVIGSRAMTPYGRDACTHLISGLAGYPIAIVSGLAYGVDVHAHKTALEHGLLCVGVPGSGLDWRVLYPRGSVPIARAIIERGGALISEYPPMQKAADYTFPARNRIMVGLSDAVLMIEAKERSGSLITARLATEYNRDLLVVPGSIFSPQSMGTHQFLKLGATPVTNAADILEALGLETKAAEHTLRDLTDDERRVYERIAIPCTRDELARDLDVSMEELGSLLSLLEIKGAIQEELGVVRQAP